MRLLLALPLLLTLATPAAAQLRTGDSVAVIRTVERWHAALEARDTVALRGMLAPGAVLVSRGRSRPFPGEALAGEIRWERAISRTIVSRTARVLGIAAYVNTVSKMEARANPAAISGNDAETIVLSRLGNVWFIEMVHSSVGQDD